MGFTSIDDWLAKATNVGAASTLQTLHTDWNKMTVGQSAFTAGRWYDLNLAYGTPPLGTYGELTLNAGPWNSANSWQLNTQWSYTLGSTYGSFVRVAGAGVLSQTAMQSSLLNGHTYNVVWNITAIANGSLTVSLNGVSGVARSAVGLYIETITVGAGTGGLVITHSGSTVTATLAPSTTFGMFSAISVFEAKQSFILSDSDITTGSLYHGGNVTPLTKHITAAGVMGSAATLVPSSVLLCDMLLCYPGIDLNSTATQTLLNDNSLPRYTTGSGVRAFLVLSYSYPAAAGLYAGDIVLSYTDDSGNSGATLPLTVNNTQGSIAGQIIHSGINFNNYAPFLPLGSGDKGMRSVQSIRLTAATDNPYRANPNAVCLATLVLAKPLLNIPMTQNYIPFERDAMYQIPSLPRIYDGADIGFLYYAGAATALYSQIYGSIDVSWG